MAQKTKPTQNQLLKLWDAVELFIQENEVSCAEALMQVDRISEELPELAETLCDIVGYYDV